MTSLVVYENVVAEKRGKVGIVFLNRPKALNALSGAHVRDIVDAVRAFDKADDVHVIVLTSTEKKAFAAGADIFLFYVVRLNTLIHVTY